MTNHETAVHKPIAKYTFHNEGHKPPSEAGSSVASSSPHVHITAGQNTYVSSRALYEMGEELDNGDVIHHSIQKQNFDSESQSSLKISRTPSHGILRPSSRQNESPVPIPVQPAPQSRHERRNSVRWASPISRARSSSLRLSGTPVPVPGPSSTSPPLSSGATLVHRMELESPAPPISLFVPSTQATASAAQVEFASQNDIGHHHQISKKTGQIDHGPGKDLRLSKLEPLDEKLIIRHNLRYVIAKYQAMGHGKPPQARVIVPAAQAESRGATRDRAGSHAAPTGQSGCAEPNATVLTVFSKTQVGVSSALGDSDPVQTTDVQDNTAIPSTSKQSLSSESLVSLLLKRASSGVEEQIELSRDVVTAGPSFGKPSESWVIELFGYDPAEDEDVEMREVSRPSTPNPADKDGNSSARPKLSPIRTSASSSLFVGKSPTQAKRPNLERKSSGFNQTAPIPVSRRGRHKELHEVYAIPRRNDERKLSDRVVDEWITTIRSALVKTAEPSTKIVDDLHPVLSEISDLKLSISLEVIKSTKLYPTVEVLLKRMPKWIPEADADALKAKAKGILGCWRERLR